MLKVSQKWEYTLKKIRKSFINPSLKSPIYDSFTRMLWRGWSQGSLGTTKKMIRVMKSSSQEMLIDKF